ncbi:protein of unknown function [Dethiosulfovibrio salsuginis]|uniref:Uncharacterized protein n=1 Tax=Dethiosulfovibrio salsuginis TaxID=561720 RepID=A0A1X7JJB5_9BACT|nr:protein of unknown function [Dethiosulfovibrio salsuginis]
MKKITCYTVVEGTGPKIISQYVNDLIAEGWQPFGSLSDGRGQKFAQALVKYEE